MKYKNACLSAILVTTMVSGSFLRAEVIGKSVATVNGEAIYSGEFENNFDSLVEQQTKSGQAQNLPPDWKKNSRKLLLNQMIEEKLLLQEANRQKITVPK